MVEEKLSGWSAWSWSWSNGQHADTGHAGNAHSAGKENGVFCAPWAQIGGASSSGTGKRTSTWGSWNYLSSNAPELPKDASASSRESKLGTDARTETPLARSVQNKGSSVPSLQDPTNGDESEPGTPPPSTGGGKGGGMGGGWGEGWGPTISWPPPELCRQDRWYAGWRGDGKGTGNRTYWKAWSWDNRDSAGRNGPEYVNNSMAATPKDKVVGSEPWQNGWNWFHGHNNAHSGDDLTNKKTLEAQKSCSGTWAQGWYTSGGSTWSGSTSQGANGCNSMPSERRPDAETRRLEDMPAWMKHGVGVGKQKYGFKDADEATASGFWKPGEERNHSHAAPAEDESGVSGSQNVTSRVERLSEKAAPCTSREKLKEKVLEDRIGGKVFVGGLSWETTDADLKEHFGQVGEVRFAVVFKDRETGKHKGAGKVDMGSQELAQKAIERFNGTEFNGRSITVKLLEDMSPGARETREPRPPHNDKAQDMKVFVGGLSWDTTEDSLKEHFSQAGQVTQVLLFKDRDTGRPKGAGKVTFATSDIALVAVDMLHESELHGKTIAVRIDGTVDPREIAGSFRAFRQPGYEDKSAERKVFVGAISFTTTQEQLIEYFSQCGEIRYANVFKDPHTGRHKGAGKVEFGTREAALMAVDRLDGTLLNGRKIIVTPAGDGEPARESPPLQNDHSNGLNKVAESVPSAHYLDLGLDDDRAEYDFGIERDMPPVN